MCLRGFWIERWWKGGVGGEAEGMQGWRMVTGMDVGRKEECWRGRAMPPVLERMGDATSCGVYNENTCTARFHCK